MHSNRIRDDCALNSVCRANTVSLSDSKFVKYNASENIVIYGIFKNDVVDYLLTVLFPEALESRLVL